MIQFAYFKAWQHWPLRFASWTFSPLDSWFLGGSMNPCHQVCKVVKFATSKIGIGLSVNLIRIMLCELGTLL